MSSLRAWALSMLSEEIRSSGTIAELTRDSLSKIPRLTMYYTKLIFRVAFQACLYHTSCCQWIGVQK
jgi:mitochondrial fission protein ELM1